MKLRPQWRMVFTKFKKCEACKGTGEVRLFGSPVGGFPCPRCKKAGGSHVPQILGIKMEYQLQQQALKTKRGARRIG